MIKRLLLICLLFFVFIASKAQPYGNEWINYGQKYYKIKIVQNGVYRIDSLTLFAAGIDLSTIDARNFQLFNNGFEQALYIKGEADGILNESDFIEFYGKKNDGQLDTALYVATSSLPNPYYSLINDTAVYFLTWNNSVTNLRYQLETDTAFSSYTPADYFFKEEIRSFNDAYYDGETDGVGATDARYTKAEGWFHSSVINLGATVSYNSLLNTSNAFIGGPNALIKTNAIGASKAVNLLSQNIPDHELKIDYRGSSGVFQQLVDTTFFGYELNRFTFSVPSSSLGNLYTDLQFTSVNNPSYQSNRTAVSFINIKYPHTFDLEGRSSFDMYLPDHPSQSKSFLNIQNFNASVGNVVLFDLTNKKRIDIVQNGSFFQALVPNSSQEKHCYISAASSIQTVSSITPVSNTGLFTDYSSLAVDSAYVIITNKLLMNEAQLYKQYRSTNIYGGLYDVLLVDVDELYDQFAFGVIKSPLSIKHFSEYLIDTYPSPPQDLFLIGKSIHWAQARNNATNYSKCLVPSFGNPASDMLLTEGINGTSLIPSIPTGRIAARTSNDVTLYLDKVQEYEDRFNNPVDDWMKYGLLFGGGTSLGDQQLFSGYLNGYKTIFEDTLYGGTIVKEFFKTSTAPIQINLSDTLRVLIENGVSMLSFFGHSSGIGFDQSIDEITNYTPLYGRYPFILANGCYSGDIHTAGLSASETFTLTANKGVIGYMGSTSLGIPFALDIFSTQFYKQMCSLNYGKGIGSSIKNTINFLYPTAVSNDFVRNTCYEMSLHGDPALKLNAQEKPDYKISNTDVFFDLTSETDTLTAYIVRTNIGMARKDTIFDRIIRYFPNGDSITYTLRTQVPKYKDTLAIRMPFDFQRGIGLNQLSVSLDVFNNVDELKETNNSTTSNIPFVVNGGSIIPVYPYEFAIIPTDTITLKASTANLFAVAKNYIFQLDTTDTFNSPFLLSNTINSSGGVVTWKPGIIFIDSAVYYWRVSPDSVSASSGYFWRESSFQYIQNKKGWEQAHIFQFKNNGYTYVKFNKPSRKFDFVNDTKNLKCKNGIYPYLDWSQLGYWLNGELKYVWSWTVPGMTIAVFDPASGNNWKSIAQGNGLTQYGSVMGGSLGETDDAFDFLEGDSTNRYAITNFITNNIPNGHYVLAYSQYYHSISNYENAVYSAFESLGSGQIRNVPASRPYMLFGRKGMPIGSAFELIGDSINSVIEMDTTIVSNWNEGYIASPVIGPAFSWGSLHWRQHTVDNGTTKDSIVVRLIGIKNDGTETVLANFSSDSIDVLNLSAYVNATIYPNIRLMAFMKDDSLHTPPQMDRWQVIYSPVPEAAINPLLGYSISDTLVQEGDKIQIHLPIQNIGDVVFNDSLLMNYWVQDKNNVIHPLPDKLKRNLFAPNQVIVDTIQLLTADLQGDNVLWAEVNPSNKSHSQLEQYHFNNIIRIPFSTSVDKINPLLDVTFDGIHILNNDIISAKPSILVQLKDENQFLALNDTNDFKIFIMYPGAQVATRVHFDQFMTFTPAVLPNNSCKINYTPHFTMDGTYQLIIQAKDKSDNQSGAIDYKINFEVINRSTITEVMNYPNPFSTATKFVFTLTGSEVPSTFKIQIMTISGKVVREVYQDEIGPLHIGRNITQYAWDGKDEFGDQLANGVYLYRVITKINGEDIEKRETDADQYFKKGWGKMYLMR